MCSPSSETAGRCCIIKERKLRRMQRWGMGARKTKRRNPGDGSYNATFLQFSQRPPVNNKHLLRALKFHRRVWEWKLVRKRSTRLTVTRYAFATNEGWITEAWKYRQPFLVFEKMNFKRRRLLHDIPLVGLSVYNWRFTLFSFINDFSVVYCIQNISKFHRYRTERLLDYNNKW